MTLFWHGHFATSEDKVRDVRKMLRQNETFRALATGDFRELMVATAQDPAMLAFLDAGVNVKGSPNENFAREIMELFTMGVGHYGETGHPRGRARVHRLERRRTDLRGPSRAARRRAEGLSRADRQLRWRRGDRHHHGAAGDRGLHRRQALSLSGARRTGSRAAGAARRGSARRRLPAEAVAAHRVPVARLLQPGVHGQPHQEPGRARGLDLQEARRARDPRHPRLQRDHRARWVRRCSGRRPWPAGRRGAAGSRPACCSSAATSRSRCCSRTSASCRTIATRPIRPSSRCTSASARATTSAARPCPRAATAAAA